MGIDNAEDEIELAKELHPKCKFEIQDAENLNFKNNSVSAAFMIKSLAEINKEFKDWRYICKSWPSECAREWREKEEQLAEDLGIIDKITFIDDMWDQEFMAKVINACDIYAAPSRIEGFGMIQVEAMACAKPVISINAGGPAETIIHGKTGFLAKVAKEIQLCEEWAYPSMGYVTKQIVKFDKPKTFGYRADIESLKNYTLKLLTDEALCKTMGEEGRKHVVQNLDYRVTSKKMLDIIKERLNLE